MITKNSNILFFLFPTTYVPFAIVGTFYAKGDFSNAPFILYALLPLAVSIFISVGAYIANTSGARKDFIKKISLAKFSVATFVLYVLCLIIASLAILAIRGFDKLPMVLGAWSILLTIFSVYLFCWLYAVYRILYKDNIDFM